MFLNDIKRAVRDGFQVHWKNKGYVVKVDSLGQWLLIYQPSGYAIGLTHMDGVTMNGDPLDFFIGGKNNEL